MNAALRQLYFGDGQFYELSPDDDFQFDFDDSLFDAAAREILDNGGYTPDYLTTPTGSALINETNRAFTDAISKGLGEQPDPAVAAALRENAFIFSGFKTHAELEQVAQLLTDENGNIRPFNDFLNDVQKLNKDYNHTYLRTEYNQAVQAAQMASKWADFERDKDFINLQYRTANDERVRASHRILHGVTLPVDDKFWQQYTPPNGWGCRCTVVAVPKDDPDHPIKDVHGSTIDGKEVFPTPAYEIFKTNTAKDKKLFPDKHPYLPKSCATCPLNTASTLSRKDVKRDCAICDTRKKYFEIGKKIYPNDWHVILPENKKGGYLVVQDGHGADEREQNIKSATPLVSDGYRVELRKQETTIENGRKHKIKSHDAFVNDEKWEFKYTEKYENLAKSIGTKARQAVEQGADVLLVDIVKTNQYGKNLVILGVKNAFKYNMQLQKVCVMIESNTFYIVNRNDFRDGTYIDKIKKWLTD